MRSLMIPAAAAAFMMACTPAQTERRSGDDTGAETGMRAGDTATTGTPMGDRAPSLSGIVSRLELANWAEIETSRLATTQARSAQVKEIARQLVTDHTKSRSELEALAKQKGIDVLPPEGGSTRQDTIGVLALKGLKGAAFDSAFVQAQIKVHQENLDAIQNQLLPSAQDEELRQYLEKTQADMQKHLAKLQQIQGQLSS
jgi:putative membrane protein